MGKKAKQSFCRTRVAQTASTFVVLVLVCVGGEIKEFLLVVHQGGSWFELSCGSEITGEKQHTFLSFGQVFNHKRFVFDLTDIKSESGTYEEASVYCCFSVYHS